MASRPRRALVLAGAAALLSTSFLAGCGFNRATDRPYTPAWGANDQTSEVYVLSAAVVAGEDGKGTFVATLSNRSQSDEASLTSIGSTGEPSLQAELSQPVKVPPRGSVNLGDEGGIPVTGDFEVAKSQYVTVDLTFEGAQSVEMQVPVIPAEGDFHDFGGSSSGSASESPSETASPSESGH